jgi:hypothetical protein
VQSLPWVNHANGVACVISALVGVAMRLGCFETLFA